MEYEPILPLQMMVFQTLFWMVAVAIEAGILRQRLRLGFQTSVQYAAVTNLAAVVFGWIAFLVIEPLASLEIKTQIMNYVLFNRILMNGWSTESGAILLGLALVSFFGTFFIKAKGLEFFLRSDNAWHPLAKKPQRLPRDDRYAKARGSGRDETTQVTAAFTDAVIQANAASFSAILLLIVLRAVINQVGV
ncbi:MAG: filament integrity protein FraC [Cyanobacteria bacterium J06598_1]